MKAFISSIDLDSQRKQLKRLGFTFSHEENILMEYFDMLKPRSFKSNAMKIMPSFIKLLTDLQKLVQKGTLESQHYYLTLIDKDEKCFLVLHHIQKARGGKLQAIHTIDFELEEWANIEELLLNCGFTNVCTIEEQRFIYAKNTIICKLVLLPTSIAFLEVQAESKSEILHLVTELGFQSDDIVSFEE